MQSESGKKLYSIGEVSKMCSVSKKALRFYDEIGIISPDQVASNRYRYYSRESLLNLTILKYYKQMGFKLEEMRDLLLSGEYREMERGFLNKIKELNEEQRQVHVKLTSVNDWYDLLVEAQNVLEYLNHTQPHMIVGYSDQLRELAQNNMSEFIRYSEEKAMEFERKEQQGYYDGTAQEEDDWQNDMPSLKYPH